MSITKQIKDQIIKNILGADVVPRELFDLHEYFRQNGAIHFEFHKEDGKTVAVSKNFRLGSIVTSGKNKNELDKNIKDAILTSFELPAVYKKEAGLYNKNSNKQEYALA